MYKIIIPLIFYLLFAQCDQSLSQSSYSYTDSELEISILADTIYRQIRDGEIGNKDELDDFFIAVRSVNSDFSKGLEKQILGRWYRKVAESDNAQETVIEAEKLFKDCCYYSKENARVKENYSGILSNAGLMNYDTLLYNKAIGKITESIEIARVIKDTSLLLNGIDFMADVNYYGAYRKNNYNKALSYYKIVEEINKRYRDTYILANNALGFANVYRKLGDTKQELYYFNLSEEISKKENYLDVLYALYFDKAFDYDLIEDYTNALKYKLIGYKYVLQSKNKEFINRADRQLWETYKELGIYDKALHHYEKYQQSIAEMNKSEVLELESELKYKEEIIDKEIKIEKLENENLRSTRNLLLLVAGLSGVLLLLSIWTNRRLKRNNRELENKNKEILLAQVTGQNIERKRMAGELHDNLNTKIAAIRWQLEAIQETETLDSPEILETTINQLNDAYEDIRLISHNLMPETVQSIGLVQSIEDLIQKLNQNDKVHFHFVNNDLNEVKFGSLAYPVYNIIFEMVNNILKHADANNAWISIHRNAIGDLKISVSDDGKGFEVDEIHGGYGIKNITSRVENLHGACRIESAPGKGTKIYMEIPYL